ncbi:MAG: penicillin-binding protein, partial [Terriglobus sp.]
MNSSYRQPLTAPIRRVRFVWMAIFFMVWTGLIASRLFWLQVVRHHDWLERASKQQQRTFEVAPRRGILYDRNLRELAVTVLAESVYAVPSELGDNRSNVADLLSGIVHADPTDNFTSRNFILARLNASRNFAWIARKLTPEQAQRVRELNLKGV